MRSLLQLMAIVVTFLLVGTGCGDGEKTENNSKSSPTPSKKPILTPAQELSSRAAFALDRAYTAEYRFLPKDARFGATETTVRVNRTPEAIRIDIARTADSATQAHTLSIIQNGEGTYQCVSMPTSSACILAAAPQTSLPDDPHIQHPFTDWLDHLVSPHAALSVERTTPSQDSPLNKVRGECYSLERVTASVQPPVGLGMYCLDEEGAITGLALGFGTLTLASQAPAEAIILPAPPSATLPSTAVATTPTPTQ